jgi:hypothetical protein
MKDFCRKMFLRYYNDALGLDADIPGQAAYQHYVADNVKGLIGKASRFHFGPEDAFVSPNPFSLITSLRGADLLHLG